MGVLATQPPRRRVSVADYLRFERDAVEKHEYRDGQIVAMAGGVPDHSLITANVIGVIGRRLKGSPCRVYSGDLLVSVDWGTGFVYPDASVICGPVERDPSDPSGHTVMNPRVIAEVLFPSTEAYDRGDKFRSYMTVAGFQEYVLVSQVTPVVETITRQADGSWVLRVYQGLDAVARVQTLGIDLPLADVFAGVEFPPPPAEPTPPGEVFPPHAT